MLPFNDKRTIVMMRRMMRVEVSVADSVAMRPSGTNGIRREIAAAEGGCPCATAVRTLRRLDAVDECRHGAGVDSIRI